VAENGRVGQQCIYHWAALVEKKTAPISGLSAVANHMRQRRLGDLAREVCALGRAVTE